MDNPELGSKKVAELRVIATQLGISDVESLKKEELLKLIEGGAGSAAAEVKERPKRKRMKEEPQDEPKKDLFSKEKTEDKPVSSADNKPDDKKGRRQ